MKKGIALESASHLFNVQEFRSPGQAVELFAKCVKQTNVTESPWSLNIQLDNGRNVTSAHCSCPGGLNGKCKHIFSLVHFINNERTEGKTDEICQFKAPSQRGRQLYPKGKTANEIFKFEAPIPRMLFQISEEEKSQIEKDLREIGDEDSMMAILLKKRKVCS